MSILTFFFLKTVKYIYKIKKVLLFFCISKPLLGWCSLSTSFGVNSSMALLNLVISHIWLSGETNCLRSFLRLGHCFTCILRFFKKNIYPFYGYFSKFIFLLAWQDNDEKPCLTLCHEFSWHIHQPEDKVILIQSFIWVLTFFFYKLFFILIEKERLF